MENHFQSSGFNQGFLRRRSLAGLDDREFEQQEQQQQEQQRFSHEGFLPDRPLPYLDWSKNQQQERRFSISQDIFVTSNSKDNSELCKPNARETMNTNKLAMATFGLLPLTNRVRQVSNPNKFEQNFVPVSVPEPDLFDDDELDMRVCHVSEIATQAASDRRSFTSTSSNNNNWLDESTKSRGIVSVMDESTRSNMMDESNRSAESFYDMEPVPNPSISSYNSAFYRPGSGNNNNVNAAIPDGMPTSCVPVTTTKSSDVEPNKNFTDILASTKGQAAFLQETKTKDTTKAVAPIRMSCCARGMKADHNAQTAYFMVPIDAEHGMHLVCSHKECRKAGNKFRYCAHCKKPVTKRNFRARHLHADLTKKRVPNNFQSNESNAPPYIMPSYENSGMFFCQPIYKI